MAPRARLTPPPFTQGNSLLYLLIWTITYNFICKKYSSAKGFPGGSVVKNLTVNEGDVGLIPGLEDPLEKELATHSSILACKIPWTEESGVLELNMTD